MGADTEARIPYVGPKPFEPDDYDLFFGRDHEAGDLLSLVIAHRVVLLHAQSGAGKTSLINAGMLPQLRAEGFEVLPPARVQGLIPNDFAAQDVEAIRNIFVFNTLMSWIDWSDKNLDPHQLVQMSIAEFLAAKPHVTGDDGFPAPRVIILDQFEELLTTYAGQWKSRDGFFEQIREALDTDNLLRVLFVIRDDFLAQFTPYTNALPELLRKSFYLEHLRRNAALQSIKKPLAVTNRTMDDDAAETILQELLKTRVRTAIGEIQEVEGEFVQPVQLQVICRSLWEHLPPDTIKITQQHVRNLGDVDQSLANYYEHHVEQAASIATIPESQLRRWFEEYLITPADTRAPVFQGESTTGGIPNTAVSYLVNAHLVHGFWRAAARYIELTHDRFIKPIQESNRAWFERQARLMQEQRIQASRTRIKRLIVASAAIVAVMILIVGLLIAENRAARDEAQNREALSSQRQRSLELALNAQDLRSANVELALALAIEANVISQPGPEAREVLVELANRPGIRRLFEDNTGAVLGAAIADPDSLTVIAGSRDQILIWDKETALLIDGWQFDGADIRSIAFSETGQIGVAGTSDGTLMVLDLDTREMQQRKVNSGVNAVALSANGMWAVAGLDDNTVLLWDLASDSITRLEGHTQPVTAVAISLETNKAVSGAADGTMILWDVESGESLPMTAADTLDGEDRIEGRHKAITAVAISPDGEQVLSGSCRKVELLQEETSERCIEGQIVLWSVSNTTISNRVFGHSSTVTRLAYGPPDNYFVSGSADGSLIIWDLYSLRPLYTLSRYTSPVTTLSVSADGEQILVGSEDKALRLWDIASVAKDRSFTGHTNYVTSVALSANGERAVSSSLDGSVILWDVATGDVLDRFEGENGTVWDVAISPDEALVLSAAEDGTLTVWNTATGTAEHKWQEHSAAVRTVAINPEGTLALSGSYNGELFLWDLVEGQLLGDLGGHETWINDVEFSHNGQLALSASFDDTLILWDVELQSSTATLAGHNDNVTSVAFSPDDTLALSGSSDRSIILWDTNTGTMMQRLSGHDEGVSDVMFIPQSTWAVSASLDGTMIVWNIDVDLHSGEQLRRYRGHFSSLTGIAISPDGKFALTSSLDRRLIKWALSLSTPELIDRVFTRRYVPELTCAEREKYKVLPLCDDSFFPTRTPYPTPTPNPPVTMTSPNTVP